MPVIYAISGTRQYYVDCLTPAHNDIFMHTNNILFYDSTKHPDE